MDVDRVPPTAFVFGNRLPLVDELNFGEVIALGGYVTLPAMEDDDVSSSVDRLDPVDDSWPSNIIVIDEAEAWF